MRKSENDKKVVLPEYGEITIKEFIQIQTVQKRISNRAPALKSTLFGKFYEVILEQYFVDIGFKPLSPKLVKWREDVFEPMVKREYNFNHIKHWMRIDGLPNDALMLADRIKESCDREKRLIFRPDFLLEKENKYFIVEAKSWPEWRKKLDWSVTIDEVGKMPQILATYARHRGKRLKLGGFILVWYSRSEEHNSILKALNYIVKPLNLTFDIHYIEELLPLIASKLWFQEIVSRVREEVLIFLESVKKGMPEFHKFLKSE